MVYHGSNESDNANKIDSLVRISTGTAGELGNWGSNLTSTSHWALKMQA
jgi:hypothetical protein